MELTLIVSLVVLAVLCVLIWDGTRNMTYVRSGYDGEQYIVEASLAQSADAARAMSVINERITRLMGWLKSTHPRDRVTLNLLTRFNPDRIAEITPGNAFGFTSYTVDKGKSMRLCLRDKASYNLHEIEELTFVGFHELAHVADWESDHALPFWQVFKYLLIEAKSAGIYNPTDYAVSPMKYCGMDVAYNPYFDSSLSAYSPTG